VLDLRLIRQDPERVRAALHRRGAGDEVDAVLELDARRRALLPEIEELRARKNRVSDEIAAARREGSDAASAIEQMRAVGGREKELTAELSEVEEQLQRVLSALPNLPADDVPNQDTVLREVGEPRVPPPGGGPARDHLELAGPMIDMEHAARVSGARFAYLRGDLVLLELGLVRWAFDRLRPLGFEPVIPPVLVREQALFGTGMLPDTEQQIYRLADDELYLVGTSEVPLASLHQGEILDSDQLPLRYGGFSTCFRREAGAAGRDTRGIFRVHQFDKVEMFSFVSPEASEAEHERLLSIQEGILSELEIPYRVVSIGVAELGASTAKKYDLEAWLPSQERYRELTSTSNTTDYQARRLDIRLREDGRTRGPLHTLNGTAVAVGRTIIALLENGQREDGSVELPSCLTPYGVPESLGPV
jgi:seryl-tRNA synthetase